MWFCHISRNKDGNLLENICTICCIAQDKVRCGWVGTYPYLPPGDKPRSSHMKLSCAWNNREHFTRLNGCQVIRQPVFSVSLRLSGWWFVMETNPSILFKQWSARNRVEPGWGWCCLRREPISPNHRLLLTWTGMSPEAEVSPSENDCQGTLLKNIVKFNTEIIKIVFGSQDLRKIPNHCSHQTKLKPPVKNPITIPRAAGWYVQNPQAQPAHHHHRDYFLPTQHSSSTRSFGKFTKATFR